MQCEFITSPGYRQAGCTTHSLGQAGCVSKELAACECLPQGAEPQEVFNVTARVQQHGNILHCTALHLAALNSLKEAGRMEQLVMSSAKQLCLASLNKTCSTGEMQQQCS